MTLSVEIGVFWADTPPSSVFLRTSITLPVLLLERRLDVLECLVVACSFFKSSMFVMLDLFICPLAVRFWPDMSSRAKASLFELSALALAWAGSSSWGNLVPGGWSGMGDASEADEPCSWLDVGEQSGLLASGRWHCGRSLEDSWKTGEPES
jgi:hypothetical protein